MTKILKLILPALISFSALSAEAHEFSNETLHYVITYKWGLITKDSGNATLTLKNNGANYDIRLVGKTKPWADSFFSVRDTLVSIIDKASFRPKKYMKMAHEGGNYSKDVIDYSYSGNNVTGNVDKYKVKKDKISSSTLKLNSTGPTFDMLSVFYYLRTIDPDKIDKGEKLISTLFSGSYAETVTIWKEGESKVKMRDGSSRDAWHLKFKFTSKGGKKSSDDIDAWISKDANRIPLQIRGSLAIGKVCAYLL